MANRKISELTAAGALTGTELVEVVQGGVNKQTTTQDIADLGGGGGGGTVESVTGDGVDNTDPDNPVLSFPTPGDISAVATSDFAKYVIDQASASTAGGTITLDMNSQISRSFVGSASFATAKAIALSNTTNSLFFNFFFEVTNLAAELTPPSDWLMAVEDFDGTDWVPPATGRYEIGGSFDDTNDLWYVKIAGPFT